MVKDDASKTPTKTLSRGLWILEELCKRAGGATQSEVARLVGIDRSTALRFLSTLELEGYIYRIEGGYYRPTIKIAEMARGILEDLEIKRYARNQLKDLSSQTSFSSHLALLSNGRIVYVDGEQAPGMVKVNADIGTVAPIHCSATGKALIAYLPPDEQKRMIANHLQGKKKFTLYTPRTATDPLRLTEEFSLIQTNGYATDDEEYEPGVRCIAAPIFDAQGRVLASASVSGTTAHIDSGALAALAVPVCVAADKISMAIGCSNPQQYRMIRKEK